MVSGRRPARRGLTTGRAAFDDASRTRRRVGHRRNPAVTALAGWRLLAAPPHHVRDGRHGVVHPPGRQTPRALGARGARREPIAARETCAHGRIAARRARIGRRDAAFRRPASGAPRDRAADRSARRRDRAQHAGRRVRRRRHGRDGFSLRPGAGVARRPDRRLGDTRSRRRRVVIGSDERALAIRTCSRSNLALPPRCSCPPACCSRASGGCSTSISASTANGC